MARQSKREVAETPLWSVNKVVNVASSMVTMPPIRSGPCSGMRGASSRCSCQEYLRGTVIGHRVGESRERGRLDIGRKGGRVEAKVSNRIYLEDRIAGDIPGNRGFRCGVVGRCSRISAKNFAGVL